MESNYTENQFEEFEKYDVVSDRDVFTKIWTEPRRIFKFINDTKYEKYYYLLLFLAGVVRAFDRASSKSMGDDSSLLMILFSAIVFGGAFGWISYYIYSVLLSWTGKWLGGIGDTSSIFRMMAYAMIPSVLILFFLFPQIAIYGRDVFSDIEYIAPGSFGNIVRSILSVFQIILSLATLVFMVIGLSVVQKFSVGKAILNLILPILIIILPIVLVFSISRIF